MRLACALVASVLASTVCAQVPISDDPTAVFVMRADGSSVRKVAQVEGFADHAAPRWSHDGKQLLFDAAPTRRAPRTCFVVNVDVTRGNPVLESPNREPLLVLDRVDKGRVAQFYSDHIWLWSRGYEGGGPQSELLRRLAHWLMKEPDLEEEALRAEAKGGRLEVERRSLTERKEPVTVIRPSGKMMSALPALTASIRERTAIGFMGSSGAALASFRNGRTHHNLAMPTSMAKIGLRWRSESARPASRKLT